MQKLVAIVAMLFALASANSTSTRVEASTFCSDEEFAQQVSDGEEGIEIYFFTGFCVKEPLKASGKPTYTGTTGNVYNVSWNGKKGWAVTGE